MGLLDCRILAGAPWEWDHSWGSVWQTGWINLNPCLPGACGLLLLKPGELRLVCVCVCLVEGRIYFSFVTFLVKGNTDSSPHPQLSSGPVQADKQFIPTRTRAHPQDLRVQDGF
jgi:hypothetical protein